MKNFKSALSAFLRKELKHKELAEQLKQALEQTPDDSAQILSYLTDLHKADQLSLEIYAALKFQIEQFEQKTRMPSSSWSNLPEENSDVPVPGMVIRENYRLIEPIGKGGTGVVWKAIDLVQEAGDSRTPYVAIKFLNRNFKQQALIGEFARYQRLSHPNIVRADELSHTGGTVFMVMEFMSGIPLKQLIKNYPEGLSLEKAKPIIQGMAHALSYAHKEGIAHLDFKPANVFYDPEAQLAKVIDFGIAWLIKQSEREGTLSEQGALTEPYASREMLLSLEHPAPVDDIYALACVTYELLSGKHPFESKTSAKAENEQLSPKPIEGLSRQQNQALERALAFRRKERTQTVDEFLAELFPKKKKSYGLVIGVLLLLVAGFGGFALVQKPFQNTAPATQVEAHDDQNLQKEEVQQALQKEEVQQAEPQKEFDQVAEFMQQCQKHFDAQRLTTAQACYQEVLRIEPDNPEALVGLKAIHLAERQQEMAKLLQQCQKHFDAQRLTTAQGCYQEVLKNDPDNPEALVGLKATHLAERQQEEAKREKEQAQVAKLLQQCQKHFEAQRLTTAQACYQEVLKIDSDNPQALVGLKATHLAERQQEEVPQKEQAQVAKLLQQCQKHFNAQRLTTGRGGTALACYQKVLRLEPDNPQALAGLKAIENRYVEWAKKALSQKRFDKVEKYLTSLEKVNPDSPALADLRAKRQPVKKAVVEDSRLEAAARQIEEDRKKAEAERRRLEAAARQIEEDRKKAEAERRRLEAAAARQIEEDRKKAEAERRRLEAAARQIEEDRKKAEAERRRLKAAAARQIEEDRKKAEAERHRLEAAARQIEEDRKKAEAERRRLEAAEDKSAPPMRIFGGF
jgi:serine/threonine protein kinase